MSELRIDSERRSHCTITFGRQPTDAIGEFVATLGEFSSCALLYDPAVEGRAGAIASALAARSTIRLEGGERGKTIGNAAAIGRRLLDARLDRRSLLVSVGGGVTTDLGGFVASLYMRGIASLLVPTTLLAMCDAAIGGKTGVDVDGVKNILGTFSSPLGVWVDPSFLTTLGADHFAHGMVEVIKKGAILDAPFFAWIEENLDPIVAREEEAVDRVVERSARLKGDVVGADEREGGRRMLLNYGHTVGHAIETLTSFRCGHGEAVAIGMAIESKMTGPSEVVGRVVRLVDRLGLPSRLPTEIDIDELWRVMESDKKNVGGKVRVAVPTAIGAGRVRDVTRADLERALS